VKIDPLVAFIPLLFWGMYRRTLWRAQYNMWVDERGQARLMGATFMDMIENFPKSEYAAYLSGDFIFMWPWVHWFGPSNKWLLAIPHAIVTLLGFWVFYLICKKYMKTIWGCLIAFAVFAFNEELRIHAYEVRPYAVLPTLSLASFYFQHKLILEPETLKKWQKWAMGLFFLVTILYHAYGIMIAFLPTIFFLGLILREPNFWQRFKKIFLYFLPIVILAAPLWIISIFGHHLIVSAYGTFEYTPNPIVDPIAFLKFIFGNLTGYRKFYAFLPVLVLGFALPSPRRYKIIGFFTVLIALPLALIFLADVRSGYWFIQRQWIWAIPFYHLTLGLCFETMIEYFVGIKDPAFPKNS